MNTLTHQTIRQAILVAALVTVSLLLANQPSADDIYKPLIGYLMGQLTAAGASGFMRKPD